MKHATKFFSILATGLTASSLYSSNAKALSDESTINVRGTTTQAQPAQAQPTQTTFIMPTAGGSTGGSAAESGRSVSIQQIATAGVNVVAGYQFGKICATGPSGVWACPLALNAALAAKGLFGGSQGSKAAGDSMAAFNPADFNYGAGAGGTGTTYGDPGYGMNGNGDYGSGGTAGNGGTGTGTGGSGTGTPGSTGVGGGGGLPPGSPTSPSQIEAGIRGIMDTIQGTGATISPDGRTLTTKDGRKFDLGAGGSGSEKSLMAMGMSAAEASQASAFSKKLGAQLAAKYAKLAADGAGGGGGSARAPAADSGAGGAGFNPYAGMGGDPRNRNRVKPKVSGLTKKLGDDTIGVSGDDIFEMVTRRYKARDQENQFLKD